MDERYVYRGGSDTELYVRVRQRHPQLFSRDLGLPEVVHIEHDSRPFRKRKLSSKENAPLRAMVHHGVMPEYCMNGPDWGLAQYELPEWRHPEERAGQPQSSAARRARLTPALMVAVPRLFIARFRHQLRDWAWNEAPFRGLLWRLAYFG